MILLLGGTGYVGEAFQCELAGRGLAFRYLTRAAADYGRFSVHLGLLRESSPTFVINCAGFTGKPNVDACESAKADTLVGNILLPQTIAHAFAAVGTCLVGAESARVQRSWRTTPHCTSLHLVVAANHPRSSTRTLLWAKFGFFHLPPWLPTEIVEKPLCKSRQGVPWTYEQGQCDTLAILGNANTCRDGTIPKNPFTKYKCIGVSIFDASLATILALLTA